MIAKSLFQSVAWIAALGALLFVPAGTLHWPAAWVFVGVMLLIGLGCSSWLAKYNPELLAERLRPPIQASQPAADKKIVLALGVTFLIWFVVMGLDERLYPSRMPLGLQILGLALLVGSTILIMRVFRENSFAAAVVKVQSERGHHVVSTGPYALVRHPMYSSALLFFLGSALLLGSWWGTAMSPVFAILFGIRTGIEENALTTGLPGYAEYAARVRYRLVPGVW
jgi:protein-S-isoprenylcysteine O-methyltransferase Ste14